MIDIILIIFIGYSMFHFLFFQTYKQWKEDKQLKDIERFNIDNQWGKFWGIQRDTNETHEDFMKRLWLASGLDRSRFQSPYPWPPKDFYTKSNVNGVGCETKQKLKKEAEKRFRERAKKCEGSETSVLVTDESPK